MSARRRKGLAPSLFPFLAVLVCTLGTLILLLALVAQNATDAAEQQAEMERVASEKIANDTPRLGQEAAASMIEEESFRVEQLVAVRDKQTGDVEKRRDQLTHMEDHISRLRDELKQLSTEIEKATGVTETNVVDISAIEELKKEIEEQEAAIAQLRAEAADKRPRVVIVPHKGPNGTDRRPIYIECSRDGVTVWPEGSQISTLHLSDSRPTANPLDGALRAIRYHSLQKYGDTTPPYPLLVVRPDGIKSYAAARKAMKDWDDQFGYELVPAEVKLAFPKPDGELKKKIDLAIRDAAAKQHARHAMTQRAARDRRERLPTLSAANMARNGRANGYRPYRDPYSPTGRSPYISPSSQYGSPTTYSSGNGAGNYRDEAIRKLDDHLRTAADEMKNSGELGSLGSRYGGPNGPASAPGTPPSLRDSTGQSRRETGPSGSGFSYPGGTSARVPLNEDLRQPLTDPVTGMALEAAGGGRRDSAQGFDPTQSVDPARIGSANQLGSPLGSGLPQDRRSGLPQDRRSGLPQEQLPGDPSNTNSSNDPSAQATANPFGQQAQQQAGDANPATANPLANMEFSDGAADGNRADGNSQRQGDGDVARRQSGNASHAPTRDSMSAPSLGSDQPSSASASPNVSNSASQAQPVRRQGRDWALPESVARTRGNKIVRTIRVQCYEDRFVLLPSRGSGATEMFGFSDGHVNRATLELATAVRDRVERWGAAIPGGRWQPRLDVEVMPHGTSRFHQLRTLMQGSGVEVKGRNVR